jgi:hypothetical protein
MSRVVGPGSKTLDVFTILVAWASFSQEGSS